MQEKGQILLLDSKPTRQPAVRSVLKHQQSSDCICVYVDDFSHNFLIAVRRNKFFKISLDLVFLLDLFPLAQPRKLRFNLAPFLQRVGISHRPLNFATNQQC